MAPDGSQPDSTTPVSDAAGSATPGVAAWPFPVVSLERFLEMAYTLDTADFEILVDQAIVLLRDLYVHLPQKRVVRGIDPIQRLRLLRLHLPDLLQRQFHDEMLAI